MQPIQHPGTMQLIHQEMVQRELERNRGSIDPTGQCPGTTGRREGGIRRRIDRLLVVIGTRIDPGQRQGLRSPEVEAMG